MENVNLLLDYKNMHMFQIFLEIVKTQNSDTEFEIRFQQLSQQQFEQIKTYIDNDKYFITKNKTRSISYIYSNDIRKEQFGEQNTNEFKEVYQIKNEVKSLILSLNDIRIKLNISREINIQPSSVKDNIVSKIRDKYRTTYTFDYYNIDLTYVVSTDDKNQKSYSFEVEIEFQKNNIKTLNDKKTLLPVKYLLKLVKPDRFSFMDKTTELNIKTKYINLLPIRGGNVQNYIYENKPVNFQLENIETFNHSITNKLNGINYFLYFDEAKGNVYLINNSTVEYLGNYNPETITKKIKEKLVIQGELYHDINKKKYTFYIFDVLIVGNKKVIDEYHKNRLDAFFPHFSSLEECLFHINKNISLQYKMFYGINPKDPNDNHYNNLMECLNSLTTDKNGNIDMEINDGFIFTPMNEPYINKKTYKYKFPETMTIDFSVQFIEKRNSFNIYDLFVYKEGEKLVRFMPFGNNMYYLICDYNTNGQLCNQIKNNSIIECLFDKNDNKFIPYRIRYDKTLPNYYTVANRVFNDIMKPITLKMLQDSFRNKFASSILPIQANIIPYIAQDSAQEIVPYSEVLTKDDADELTYIDNIHMNITLKSKTNTLIESILFSVSPEYRGMNTDEKNIMLKIAKTQFDNDENKLNDIILLSNSFNINIYILEPLKDDKFNIKKRTYNEQYKDNKLYIVEYENYYEVFGYKINEYEVYIY
jgi:hypothetical protein